MDLGLSLLNNLLCLFLFILLSVVLKAYNRGGERAFSNWFVWVCFLLVIYYAGIYVVAKIFVIPFDILPKHVVGHLGFFERASTCVFVILAVFLFLALLMRDYFFIRLTNNILPSKRFVYLLFWFSVFLSFYKIISNKFYGLSYEGERSLFDVLVFNCSSLSYLGFYVTLLSSHLNHKRLFILLVYCGLFVLDILYSTSKAPVLIVFLIYVFWSVRQHRRIRLIPVLSLCLLSLLAFLYSYYSRFNFNVYNSGANFTEVLSSMAGERDLDLNKLLFVPLFTRFEHLFNFVVVYSRIDHIDLGYYKLGSLVELVNVVPRVLWRDRPFVSFNYFVTSEIYNSMKFWSSSIGRLGESFLVVGWFAPFALITVFAAFHSFILGIKRLFQFGSHAFEYFYFLFILFFSWHDDYVLQGFLSFLISCFSCFILFIIAYEKKNYRL